ncbi:MAG: signal peptide peptidase SppA [Flavobacteriales bacterium]|nr:signal peptide peptidase SppA [Flavobacteriales bacterium]MCB9198272.1 signal peptide peptidase SppA [Flavobacteriales bacterium]
MKPFWRNFWASFLAFFVVGITMMILFFVVVFSAIGSAFNEKPFDYADQSVLMIKFDESISEKSFATIDGGALSLKKALGIKEIKLALEAAAKDDKIEGIVLNVANIDAGMASIEEIRNAIIKFKESGKFVVAYSEMYAQKSYYLATAADEIYLNPAGMVEFRGLGAELMFFKGMIDKLGIEMQIIRGSNNKFKSAVEPLMLDSMSPANRKQTMTYINAMWDQMLKGISETRGITVAELNVMADSVYVRNAKTSESNKLVDGLKFEDEVMALVAEKAKVKEVKDLELVNFSKYAYYKSKAAEVDNATKKANIAVVYAVGGIESGKGDAETIGSETIAESIRDARLNEDIKAVVLRINSPGGSALASDVIWREVILTKEVKPVIVSMGDVAASGGYYIACAADRIFAQPNTITGSIGVFGVLPNFGPMLEEKFGITTDRVETNEHAVLTLTKSLTTDEYKIIQQGVDEIYDDFTKKVAEGRGKTQAEIDSIGQGRVWAGTDALNIGLVDELGGIDEAIDYALEQAKIKKSDMVIKSYPDWDSDFMELLMQFDMADNDKDKSSMASEKLRGMINTVDRLTSMKGVQARLPYEIVIE